MTVLTALGDSALRASVWIAQATPTPTLPPAFTGNEDTITPTWVGFAFTFGVFALTLLLILDMTRRVRRVRYRGEIRERLAAEAAVDGLVPGTDATATVPETQNPAAPPAADR